MSDFSLSEINERISKESVFIDKLRDEISSVVIGQTDLINRLLIGMLANGHILIEGVPGLAKTLLVKTIAQLIDAKFQRIQFTPDMLPADLIGTLIYNQKTGGFETRKGPIFSNIILADEINRSPAKVQSALLESMQERQVTISEDTFIMDNPFLVLATQNPIEQEGTYPLPEAQLDRFLMHVDIDYPGAETELEILRLTRGEALSEPPVTPPTLTQDDIFTSRKEALSLYMAPELEQYLVQLIMATRQPANFDAELGQWIAMGTSPRATISLDRCARAHAWLSGRDFVGPDDIQAVVHNVLRHRIILSYQAEAEGVTINDVLDKIVATVAVP